MVIKYSIVKHYVSSRKADGGLSSRSDDSEGSGERCFTYDGVTNLNWGKTDILPFDLASFISNSTVYKTREEDIQYVIILSQSSPKRTVNINL